MLCTDNFGNEVHRCRFTGVPVSAAEGVVVGAIVPGVKARYLMANTEEARRKQKMSGILFHESEANCNTCKHLQRVKHEKNVGFLYGKCGNPEGQPEKSPYASRQKGDVMVFHPDDPMHMPCYVSRWEVVGL